MFNSDRLRGSLPSRGLVLSCDLRVKRHMVLLGIVALALLSGCSDPPSPEAQLTARLTLEGILSGNVDPVEQYLVPADQRPPGMQDAGAFASVASIGLRPCRGLHVDYADRSTSPPAGARLVTATFSRPCVGVPGNRPGETTNTLGILVVPIEGRWRVASMH